MDIDAANVDLFGVSLPEVGLFLTPDLNASAWDISLSGDTVAGGVKIPFDLEKRFNIDLQHLRLPGIEEDGAADEGEDTENEAANEDAEAESADEDAEEPKPRRDAFAGLDPRSLPLLKFSTKELTVGGEPFGFWDLNFTPKEDGAEITDLKFDFRGLRTGLDEVPDENPLTPRLNWQYDGNSHHTSLRGIFHADDMADVLRANGIDPPPLSSRRARIDADLDWPGSPAFFSGQDLSGDLSLAVFDGRFQQGGGGTGALKVISVLNINALMRRLRISDDLVRSGLAYERIEGRVSMEDGLLHIEEPITITSPSSLYQVIGDINLAQQTISGEIYITLPVSNNLPWVGVLTANPALVVGGYLFDRIFGDQVDSLTRAVYTLEGPWEGLEPKFKQAGGAAPK